MKTEKFTIYLGLNDKDKKEQLISSVTAYEIVTRLAVDNFGGATLRECKGIYKHDDGTYIHENTLEIILLTDKGNKVLTLVEELKKIFNQESILLEKAIVDGEFI